jgi:predicted dehydrogenase
MRYVIVGLGNIGSKRRAVLGERCVATVDPCNPAADHRTPDECPDDSYDAAVVATPNDVKLDLIRRFLDRGKHVLVEKPLILTDETARDLQARSTRHGAIWYTSYNFRFEPHVVALRDHLRAATIGRLYRARMFYGNGTAGNIAATWRDSRLGVLDDMASHLIDLTGFLFGRAGTAFVVWERRAHEIKGIDHCILATPDRTIVIESSFLSWKNRWRIEVTGERGALEMDGLTKWGRSRLVIMRRQLPSGPPAESEQIVHGPDPTWALDIAHFEDCVASGLTSCANDLWISRSVAEAAVAPIDGDA